MNNETFNDLDEIVSSQKRPPKILIYGTEGIGKSTLAAQAGAVFVHTEDGLSEIECKHWPDVATTYKEVKRRLVFLIEKDHSFPYVAIDSGDWLERIIWDQVCEDHGVTSISMAAGGFNKGYDFAMNYWREITAMLDHLNKTRDMGEFIICHADVKTFKDPENESYDRYVPRLHKDTSLPLLTERADAVLFCNSRVRVDAVKEASGKKRTRAFPIGKGGGERFIQTVRSPSCVAKNRYGMDQEIDLDWEVLEKGIGWKKS